MKSSRLLLSLCLLLVYSACKKTTNPEKVPTVGTPCDSNTYKIIDSLTFVFEGGASVGNTLIRLTGDPDCEDVSKRPTIVTQRNKPIKRYIDKINMETASSEEIVEQFVTVLDVLYYTQYRLKHGKDFELITNINSYFSNFAEANNRELSATIVSPKINIFGDELREVNVIIDNLDDLSSFDLRLQKLKKEWDESGSGYWIKSTNGSKFKMWLPYKLYAIYEPMMDEIIK